MTVFSLELFYLACYTNQVICNNKKGNTQLSDLDAITNEVKSEIERAMRKYPLWPHDPVHAAAVVAEESGELVKEVLETCYSHKSGSARNAREEAIQTAAMAIRFIIAFDNEHYMFTPSKQS